MLALAAWLEPLVPQFQQQARDVEQQAQQLADKALPAVDQATQVCMGLWHQRSDEGVGCHLSFVMGGQGPVAQVCRLTHSELWQQSPGAGLDCHCLQC